MDDDEEVRRAVGATLEARLPRVVVRFAGDGPNALALLAEAPCALVVSDYRMPGMDGIDLLRRTRRVAPDTARVLMTAYPDLDVAARAINVGGIDFFLCKPFSPQTIVEVVQACLDGEPVRIKDKAPVPRASRPVERGPAPAAADLAARIAALDSEEARLKVAFGLGKVSGASFHTLLERIHAERAALECARMGDAGRPTASRRAPPTL